MTQNTNTATQLPETLLETLQKPKTKLQETEQSNTAHTTFRKLQQK